MVHIRRALVGVVVLECQFCEGLVQESMVGVVIDLGTTDPSNRTTRSIFGVSVR